MNGLWFCDAHVEPEEDLTRFTALGNWIVEHQPAFIVQGGDFTTFDSLTEFDRHKAKLKEGRRTKKEFEVTNEAIRLLFEPLSLLQDKQRTGKKALYIPKVFWLVGNHDWRTDAYCEKYAEMDGMLNLRSNINLDVATLDLTWVPHKGTVNVRGVNFTHAIIGRTGALSSKYITHRALTEVYSSSVVFGHSHFKQESTLERFDEHGSKTMHKAICGGCFFENDPHYAEDNTNNYWRGVLGMSLWKNGWLDTSEYSLERLLIEYT